MSALERLADLETEAHVEARVELTRKNSWETRFKDTEEVLWEEP